jgi:hypothetical protein
MTVLATSRSEWGSADRLSRETGEIRWLNRLARRKVSP